MPRLKVVLETGPSSRSLALGHASRGTQGRVGGMRWRGRGECQTFGRMWSQGLGLTKSGWEESSRPGNGWNNVCLQIDQMWTDDHSSPARALGL